jgi:tetratricopeptide (TPR) repeat protein
MPSQSFNQDKELAEFFTDVEHLRDVFRHSAAAQTLPKRLLVIHGVGGVGKSSLLRMFRLHCKSVNAPVALASGDEAKSAVDVLRDWVDDLKADGVALPTFAKTFEHYRAIQAKVENEAGKIAGQAVKGAAKTMIETAASTIPGIGPLIGKLGGMGAEALVDWLHGFLTKPDIDLLLDPAKKLTDDFLADVAPVADKRRIVLMLDTFEQMTALDDWAREVAQRLHANVLLVIAGRALPNWSRAWQGWMASAQVEELKPMTEEVMRDLVRRYHATMRGGEPNPAQVEAIIRFARGLPMVVTSAVKLWIQYGVEDFAAVKPQVVADLVDRLMEGVPSALIPALEAAAVVRWFDQPILRAVMKQDDVREVYNELRRFPFVRTRAEGLALHDAVREIMDENLRVQDSERHSELHERAAAYFEKRLKVANARQGTTGEEAERLGLERLYHRIRADEEAGIQLFQEMAEELARYRLLNRLRALLNDVNTYPLEKKNCRLWREYYNARLADLEIRLSDAERVYQSIGENSQAELKLRAYALCSLGIIVSRWQRLGESGAVEKAARILEQSLSLVPLDSHLVASIIRLAHVYRYQGMWDKAVMYNKRFLKFFGERGDRHGVVNAYGIMKLHHAGMGEWKEMFAAHKLGSDASSALAEQSYFRVQFLGTASWAWAFAGRYAEAEQNLKQSLTVARHLDDIVSTYWADMQLGLLLARQNRYHEADHHFVESQKTVQALGEDYQTHLAYVQGFWGILLTRQGKWDGAEEKLNYSLATREKFQISPDIPEVLVWLGQLHEVKQQWNVALDWYNRSLELKWTGRRNFECEALTGLVRVKHAQGDYAAIPPLLAEAEQLAQQYEYNDHLASLRLTQAQTFEVSKNLEGLTALDYFKQAMVYALRYNRFLLDEVLSGRPQGSPLRPIIPHLLERGEEGRRMLTALCDWWRTGVNDIGAPRPDTISIPEGIALLEAERLAREREPGDGWPQKSVVEQIEAAL